MYILPEWYMVHQHTQHQRTRGYIGQLIYVGTPHIMWVTGLGQPSPSCTERSRTVGGFS